MSKPSNYYYIQNGNVEAGFQRDAKGNPYMLAYIAYWIDGKWTDNLLDNYRNDSGRQDKLAINRNTC